jgi:hypothetical protein
MIAPGILAVTTALALMATSSGGAASRCDLGTKYHVSSVAPYRTHEDVGYSPETSLRGADLQVQSMPGLTQVWLQSRLESQIASGVCDFGAHGVKVEVSSAGDHFDVHLIGPDRKAAEEILRRAQELTK